MHNKSKNKTKNYLIAALALLVAFSAMAASVMSGCGENTESSNTEDTTGTVIVTEISTDVVTETIVIDENGNPIEQNSNDSQNSNSESSSSGKTENSNNLNNSNNSGNSVSAGVKNENSSAVSNGSQNNDSSSAGNASSAPQKPANNNSGNNSGSSSADTGNSKACVINGKKYAVGDTVVCRYSLTAPKKLENFQGSVIYDSNCLEVTDAKLEGQAAAGSMINYNLVGKVNFNGISISRGYNYTNGGDFLTVTYKVVAPGKTTPSIKWKVACVLGKDNYNLIAKDGTPASGFKTTAVYS